MTTTLGTVISLGPSLSLEAAQAIYPHGHYHRPFQCGDIIKIIRLKPKRIAIIDGLFEQTAAIWHKEILWALSLGIEVYGASSMGALRACEMHAYGMKPFGKIAEHFLQHAEQDDDEVALTHDTHSHSSTLTMIDLRATMAHLQIQELITADRAEHILKTAKQIPYFKRTLFTLDLSNQEKELLATHGVNQKQEDAKLLLRYLAMHAPQPLLSPPVMVQSIYFRQIYRETWHAPFHEAYDWLPIYEQQYAQCTPCEQLLIIHCAKLTHLLGDSFFERGIFSEQPSLHQVIAHLAPSCDFSSLPQHLEIHYQLLFKKIELPYAWISIIALLLNGLLEDLKTRRCILRAQTIQSCANLYRAQLGLHSTQETQNWLSTVGLQDPEDYTQFMTHMAYFEVFVQKNNGEALVCRGPLWEKSWIKEIIEFLKSQHFSTKKE